MATPGTWPSPSNCTSRIAQHGVGERGHEQPDRQLARLVPQERLHDPRRELAHRQLHHDHRDRQHQRRQRDHRHGDRRQDAHRGVRPARQPARDHLEVSHTIDGDRADRNDDAGQHAQHRDEPQARSHAGGARGCHGHGPCLSRACQPPGVDRLEVVRSGACWLSAMVTRRRSDLGVGHQLGHDPILHRFLQRPLGLDLLPDFDPCCLPRRPVARHQRPQRQRGDVLDRRDPTGDERDGIITIQNTVSQPLTRRMKPGSPCTEAHNVRITVISSSCTARPRAMLHYRTY